MRRIFTLAIAFFVIVSSKNVSGQTCASPSTATLPGTAPFQFTGTAEDFSGDFSYNSNNIQSTTVGTGTTKILNTASLTVPAGTTNIGFAFSTGTGATITSFSISAVYNNGGTLTPVALCSYATAIGTNTTISFSTTNVPAVILGRVIRFRLTFTITGGGGNTLTLDNFNTNLAASATALPVRISSISVSKDANGAKLSWNVDTEENVANYQIERSADGTNFAKIGSVTAAGRVTYSFNDNAPLTEGYYRVKAVDHDGKYGLSTIVKLKGGKSGIVLRAYPSPAQNNVTIQHGTAASASRISISSQDGRLVKSIIPSAGAQQTSVDLSAMQAGMYLVRFDAGNGEVETLKIVKQ